MKYKDNLKTLLSGIPSSYAQIFFSTNQFLAIILIIISFFDWQSGLCGMLSVVVSNVFSLVLGFNRFSISKGLYGFNSLLVGLGIGQYFVLSPLLLVVVLFAALLTFFFSVAIEGIFTKYGLPFLSIPFLLAIWTIKLATKDFHALELSPRGIFIANELYMLGGNSIVELYYFLHNWFLTSSVRIYLLSLGAIFFQFNILAGVLIVVGLLVHSRIAFIYSLVGFYIAYWFYQLLGADFTALGYNYIGFNYILTSIALGGYFLIPNKKTFFWILLLLPLVIVISIATSNILAIYGLSVYSLPFNIIVLTFIYTLKIRVLPNLGPENVFRQYKSPEQNLYYFQNNSLRFKGSVSIPISLPFWGKWNVTQAHNGEITHKDDWAHAWDFEIKDGSGKKFKRNGALVTDYLCYNKAVLAPAAGYIVEIVDGIADNTIGEVNLKQNWGNTLIIKHAETLFSKLCHLKAGSIKGKIGDHVTQGQIVAFCGSSGRSPIPHLHFQLQSTPYIGSKTLNYPICHFIENSADTTKMLSYTNPQLDTNVENIEINSILKKALSFIPGQELHFEVIRNGIKTKSMISVYSNMANKTYMFCKKYNATAEIFNDGSVHYFQNYEGSTKSVLFILYKVLFKIQMGFYKNLTIYDTMPLHLNFRGLTRIIQDFVAPLYLFCHSRYSLVYSAVDDELSPKQIDIEGNINNSILRFKYSKSVFKISVGKQGLNKIEYKNNKTEITINQLSTPT